MPSGITAPIAEGKPITAAEFIMRCARQFGGLMHMRDEKMDAPITPRVANLEHYDKSIARYEKELQEYKALTLAEAATAVDVAYAESLARWEKTKAEKEATRARYEAIRDKVETWQPPTPEHDHLKQFALDQLDGSIDWDCKVYDPPVKQAPEEWLQNQIDATQSSLDFYKREREKEVKRVDESNIWVAELVESIINFHHQGLPEIKFVDKLEAPEE